MEASAGEIKGTGKLKRWLVIGGLVLLVGAGFLMVRGPKPFIELAPEPIYTFHAFDSQLEDIPDAVPEKINNIFDLSVGLQPRITNSMITSWVAVAFLVAIAAIAGRRARLVPSGLQNLFEAIFEWFLGMAESIAGAKNARRFFPITMTIFIYVLVGNWLGLLPFFGNIGLFREPEHEDAIVARNIGDLSFIVPEGLILSPPEELEIEELPEDATHEDRIHAFEEKAREEGIDLEDREIGVLVPFFRGINTDVNTPLALAIVSFVFIEFSGISALGLRRYLGKFFNFSRLRQGRLMEGTVDAGVGFLELISEFIRIVSFTFRLFGNTTAGEVLILITVFLIPFMLQTVLAYPLELFFGLIQAFIFATLTLVFAVMAVAHHGPEEDHGAHPSESPVPAEQGHT